MSEDSQNVVVLDHKVEDSNKTLSLLNSSTNPNDQGWKLFIAAGPELYQRMNNGEEYPLTVKSSKTERDYIELKSVGTDNIHFNIAKNNIPITDKSLLDFTVNVVDSQSAKANLADGSKDDGAFQMLLALGSHSTESKQSIVSHIMIITYKTQDSSLGENATQISEPGFLAATSAPPARKFKNGKKAFVEAQKKKFGDNFVGVNEVLNFEGEVKVTADGDNGDFKFIEIYGQDGVYESYTLRLRKLVEHVYGSSKAQSITHLFAVGLESTATNWNCDDDNSALCKIQNISIIEAK